MDNVIIFVIDHLFTWIALFAIGYYFYKWKHRPKIAPPKYTVHQEVIVPDYKWLDGHDRECRIIHVESRWISNEELRHFYLLMPKDQTESLLLQEDLIIGPK